MNAALWMQPRECSLMNGNKAVLTSVIILLGRVALVVRLTIFLQPINLAARLVAQPEIPTMPVLRGVEKRSSDLTHRNQTASYTLQRQQAATQVSQEVGVRGEVRDL